MELLVGGLFFFFFFLFFVLVPCAFSPRCVDLLSLLCTKGSILYLCHLRFGHVRAFAIVAKPNTILVRPLERKVRN